MNKIFVAGAVVALGLSMSGCMTAAVAKMTPQERIGTINALADAGCSGTVSVSVHGSSAAGVSPGSANGDFTFAGSCDPAKAAKPAASTNSGTPATQ